jgi:hypothetical protein
MWIILINKFYGSRVVGYNIVRVLTIKIKLFWFYFNEKYYLDSL